MCMMSMQENPGEVCVRKTFANALKLLEMLQKMIILLAAVWLQKVP